MWLAVLVILGSVAGLVTLPGEAAAAQAEFELRGSRGYAVRVTGAAGRVTLRASGPSGQASYEVAGRVTRRRVVARFGRLGRVDVRFRPGGRSRIETPPHRCAGRPRGILWGAFVGVVRFRGERGFTRARAGRATGAVRVNPRWRCRGGEKRERRASDGRRPAPAAEIARPVILDLIDRRDQLQGGAITIGRGSGVSLTLFAAVLRERRGRMKVTRSALEFGRARDFAFDDSLSKATLRPPSPFAGTGRFERRAGVRASTNGSWTGSLSVVLPGTKRISLTAPRFRARLYRQGRSGIAKPGA